MFSQLRDNRTFGAYQNGVSQYGRNLATGLENFLAGQDTMQDGMKQVFDQWNKPQSAALSTASRIMTVMFTDIVGSTERASEIGDLRWRELRGNWQNLMRFY